MEKESTFKIPRAEKYETYYLIEDNFEVNWFIERNDNRDNEYYEKYNYFINEEEAIKCAKILQETLVKLRKEEAMKENK